MSSFAGFFLRATGRLREAIQPSQTGLQAHIAAEDWVNASQSAENLGELYLIMGDVQEAVKLAKQALELGVRSGIWHVRTRRMTGLAAALHQMGDTLEARSLFGDAETSQKNHQPQRPFLYGVQGFDYCDLLLEQGHIEEVKNRATQILQIETQQRQPLAIGVHTLSLGRAALLEAQQLNTSTVEYATDLLQSAIRWLAKAGAVDFIARGLLVRAQLYRFRYDFEDAKRDLMQVQRIANRSGMALFLVDYHLEFGRLCLAQTHLDKAQEHLENAKEMINRMGYHRRDKEVQELEAQLA